jgi:hypothetical protein
MTPNNPASHREELARIIDPDGFPSVDLAFDRSWARKRREAAYAKADEWLSRPPVKAASPEGEMRDIFERPFDGDDDPRLQVARCITHAEAEAILEHRGDMIAALASSDYDQAFSAAMGDVVASGGQDASTPPASERAEVVAWTIGDQEELAALIIRMVGLDDDPIRALEIKTPMARRAWDAAAEILKRAPAPDQQAEPVAWQAVDNAPHACHVLAARFDDCEWVCAVVMSPPSYPFTHWVHLPTMPGEAPPKPPEAPAVAEGWKLVPVEPTEEMLRASLATDLPATYREHLRHPANGPDTAKQNEARIRHVIKRWANQLAAAPNPESQGQGGAS